MKSEIDFTPLDAPAHAKNWQKSVVGVIAFFVFAGALISALYGYTTWSIVLLLMTFMLGVAVLFFGYSQRQSRHARLRQFALVNNFIYETEVPLPVFQGILFRQNKHVQEQSILERLVVSRAAVPFEIGTYARSERAGGGASQKREYGYMKIALPRMMPHMLLDARANNLFGVVSNFTNGFSRNQQLALEGDFQKYYTLYCPKEYERDALYIFTPDFMDVLIRNSSQYDIEIVDNQCFVYHTKAFSLTDVVQMRQLFTIANIIGAKMNRRSGTYTDYRVGDLRHIAISPQGYRLRFGSHQSMYLVGAALLAAVVLLWVSISRGM